MLIDVVHENEEKKWLVETGYLTRFTWNCPQTGGDGQVTTLFIAEKTTDLFYCSTCKKRKYMSGSVR